MIKVVNSNRGDAYWSNYTHKEIHMIFFRLVLYMDHKPLYFNLFGMQDNFSIYTIFAS